MDRDVTDSQGITIVCVTRLSEREFYANSMLGNWLMDHAKDSVTRKILFSNSTANKEVRGLCHWYNKVIADTTKPDEILLFVHDDVFILDLFWIERLRDGFYHFDIIGVAGNTRPSPVYGWFTEVPVRSRPGWRCRSASANCRLLICSSLQFDMPRTATW